MSEPYVLKWDPEVLERMAWNIRCPDCGSALKLKEGRNGLFYGCAAFPHCHFTNPAHNEGVSVGSPNGRILGAADRWTREKCRSIIREKFPTQKDFFAWKSRTMRTKEPVKDMTPSMLNDLLSKLEKARKRN